MKISKSDFKTKLKTDLKHFDLVCDDFCLEQFWKYHEFLLQENKKYNLTGIEDPKTILSHHFLDSAAIFSFLNPNNWEKVFDVGTGAGFPGMVYKILFPGLPVFFLDSRRKRILFLQKLFYQLSLPGQCPEMIHGRAEEFGQQQDYREQFDVVVSRAVAPLNILCEYMLPFVVPGGYMYAYKSDQVEEELKQAEEAIRQLGGKKEQVYDVNVPGIKQKRCIIALKKVKCTPSKFPRRPGKPKKSPL